MATAVNRCVLRHGGGRELPGPTPQSSITSRFGWKVQQCRFLHFNRRIQSVCVERLSYGIRSDAAGRSAQRSRASRSDNSSGDSEGEEIARDINDEEGAEISTDEVDEVGDEISRQKVGQKATQRGVSKESLGFWRNLWGKVREEIDEVNEAEASNGANDEEDSDSEQEEVSEDEEVNPNEEELPETEPSKKDFWRRWWKEETETSGVDPETKVDDELLLRDLENLQFRWRELLEPSPENLLALGLTALLGFAGLQIIWQMVVVAASITLSAFKYTVLGAIIVSLLIFLL